MSEDLIRNAEIAPDRAGGGDSDLDGGAAALTEADRAVRGLADPDGAAAARGFVERAVAPNTRRSYLNDLHQVRRWLAGFEHGETIAKTDDRKLARLQLPEFDPIHLSTAEVVRFLTSKAGVLTEAGEPFYSPASITRYVAAINWLFHTRGLPSPAEDPVVRALVVGIRKDNHRPIRRTAPLTLEPVVKTLLAIDIAHPTKGVVGVRDAALILFGFVGAFRGSELAALTLGDITT